MNRAPGNLTMSQTTELHVGNARRVVSGPDACSPHAPDRICTCQFPRRLAPAHDQPQKQRLDGAPDWIAFIEFVDRSGFLLTGSSLPSVMRQIEDPTRGAAPWRCPERRGYQRPPLTAASYRTVLSPKFM